MQAGLRRRRAGRRVGGGTGEEEAEDAVGAAAEEEEEEREGPPITKRDVSLWHNDLCWHLSCLLLLCCRLAVACHNDLPQSARPTMRGVQLATQSARHSKRLRRRSFGVWQRSGRGGRRRRLPAG